MKNEIIRIIRDEDLITERNLHIELGNTFRDEKIPFEEFQQQLRDLVNEGEVEIFFMTKSPRFSVAS